MPLKNNDKQSYGAVTRTLNTLAADDGKPVSTTVVTSCAIRGRIATPGTVRALQTSPTFGGVRWHRLCGTTAAVPALAASNQQLLRLVFTRMHTVWSG